METRYGPASLGLLGTPKPMHSLCQFHYNTGITHYLTFERKLRTADL